jgi:hypothetical protein
MGGRGRGHERMLIQVTSAESQVRANLVDFVGWSVDA